MDDAITITPEEVVAASGDPVTHAAVPAVTPPSRRVAILRTGLVIGILVLVFGVILPRFIDYEDVVEAFRALTLDQLLLMSAMVLVAWLVSGWMFPILVGHMGIGRGTASYLILSGIGASVPMGPWNMGVLWVVLRGWGIPIRAATSGIALYGIVNQLTRLALPPLAMLALVLAPSDNSGYDVARFLALLSGLIFVVAAAALIAIVRSDRAADWIARTGERLVRWASARLRRTDEPRIAASIRSLRDQLGEVVRRRGLTAMTVGTVGQLVWCAVLIVALRLVGVPEAALAPAEVLAVFALTSAITIIPIAPGGAGIPELLYIGALTAIAGPSYEALITAGVMLFRLFQWFLPIPIAWMLLKVVRRGRPVLPTTAELRSYTVEGAA